MADPEVTDLDILEGGVATGVAIQVERYGVVGLHGRLARGTVVDDATAARGCGGRYLEALPRVGLGAVVPAAGCVCQLDGVRASIALAVRRVVEDDMDLPTEHS